MIAGQDEALAAFDGALASERMHHGWLLSGPRGVGKATFARRAAHALLTGRDRLDAEARDDGWRRIAEGNEPRLVTIARRVNEKTGKLRVQIDVEQIRDLRAGLMLSAGAGEWRCVIVDAAEEMNPSAANALLKLLEEPPGRVVFFLVSHAPGRLLPTIRSRCRVLDFRPLDGEAMARVTAALDIALPPALLSIARGSPGEAARLAAEGGAAILEAVEAALAPLPGAVDGATVHRLADAVAPADRDEGFAIAIRILSGIAADRATATGATDARGRAAAAGWAEAAMAIQADAERTRALNLDRRQALLDTFARIGEAARRAAS